MRQKLLLFLMMVSFGALYAQTDTIWSLVITEARFDRADAAYVELTNMGDEAVNLGEFEVVSMTPWNTFPDGALWPDAEPPRNDGRWTMLPEQSLAPGESFVIHVYMEWFEERKAKDIARFGYSQDYGGDHNKAGVLDVADLVVHRLEAPTADPTDSVSDFNNLLESWGGGRDVIFLRHHPPDADSCTVDLVNGWFSDTDGSNPDPPVFRAVAGVARATGTCVLVRQFDVKQGNREFIWGNDLAESEWIPVPFAMVNGDDTWDNNRKLFWTVGNHQDTHLDDQTLVSSTIDIDWTNHIMTVPYGVRNNDSIMSQFDEVPGIAWHYDFNSGENSSIDSAHASVRTGDTLTLFAVGNTLEVIKFHLEAAPPTADANWVIPKKQRDFDGDGGYAIMGEVFEVTHMMKEGVLDTISEIPYACRVDTLMKYLEKPEKASWEFVWVDGNERTDLMMGDKLKVTAEDGSVKEYYLKLQEYRKGRNAELSSITWPDNPLPGLYGWKGDTIPAFKSSVYTYKVALPAMTEGIPALVAKNMDDNASHSIKRATNIFGSEAESK